MIYPAYSLKAYTTPASSTLQTVAPSRAPHQITATPNIHNTTTAAPNQFQPCPFVLLVPRLIYPTHSLKAVIPPASSTLQTVAPIPHHTANLLPQETSITHNCHSILVHTYTVLLPVPRLIQPTYFLKAYTTPASITAQSVVPNRASCRKTPTRNLHNTITTVPNQFKPCPLCFWFPD